jgi:hypothetical protein
MSALSLQELKRLVQVKTQKEFFKFSYLEDNGIPKGAVTCISGTGKTKLALRFLAENPSLDVAWVEERFSVYPTAILQRSVNLNRILFIEAGKETSWAVLQALKAQVFPVVILYAEDSDHKTLRRFQLLAEKAQTAVIWLTSTPKPYWAISLKINL